MPMMWDVERSGEGKAIVRASKSLNKEDGRCGRIMRLHRGVEPKRRG